MKNRMLESDFSPSRGKVRLDKAILIGTLAFSLWVAPATVFARDSAGEVGKESGLGAAAAISSLIYGPVKLVYALGGLVVGGCAWIFTAGDSQVAETVFTRSLRGTYVVTPEILMGEERLEFIGRDSTESEAAPAAVASAGPAATSPSYEEPEYDDMGW
jgi:hypothetical protein